MVIQALPAGQEEAWAWVLGPPRIFSIQPPFEGGPRGWPARGPISATFHDPSYAERLGKTHFGIDIAAPLGSPVMATLEGEVTLAARAGTFGNLVVIETGAFSVYYAHLDEIHISLGEAVVWGQIIGTVGSTGRASGAHLHYEVRYRGWPVDPQAYLSD
jgi:murein DD-endopeptidase MepM/ murein hydrolase activator NlpD